VSEGEGDVVLGDGSFDEPGAVHSINEVWEARGSDRPVVPRYSSATGLKGTNIRI
jgi:hypothetical protein